MVLSEVYIERSNCLSPAQIGGILDQGIIDKDIENYLAKVNEIEEFVHSTVIPLLEVEIKTNDIHRNKIIQTKRKLFNGKEIDNNIIDLLSSKKIKDVIDEYLILQEIKKNSLILLEHRYLIRVDEEYNEVKTAFKNKRIYNSLVTTNKNIKVSLDRFLRNKKMDKKDKKVYLRLISFLTRAAKKCSPLGDITLSSVKGLTDQSSEPSIFTKLNYALLNKWWDRICETEYIRETKNYIVSPLLRVDRTKIYNTVLTDGEQGHLTKTKVQIKSYSLKILGFLKGSTSTNYSLFTDKFRKDLDEDSIKQVWNYLIDESLLIQEFPLEEQSEKYLETIIDECSKFSDLKEVECMLQDILKATVILEEDFTSENLAVVEEKLQILQEKLPIDHFNELNHVYFDYVHSSETTDLDVKSYQEVLYKYQMILLSFDPEVKRKILIGDEFKKLYPNGVEGKEQILTALKTIGENPEINHPSIMDMYMSRYDFTHSFNNYRVNELHRISKKFMQIIETRLSTNNELVLDTGEIDQLVEEIKDLVPDYKEYSQNIFAQLDSNSIVLNHVYPGQGMFFNRFIKYFTPEQKNKYVLKQLASTCDENVIDIKGVFGFNANLRYSITSKSLTLPYYNPCEGSYSLEDLKMSYNEKNKTIQFHNQSDRVRPLFLGTLVMTATPIPVGMINTLGANSSALGNCFEMLFDKDKEISHLPRISLKNNGKILVTNREKWKMSTTLFQNLKIRDFNSWLSLQCILNERGLPRRFYIRGGEDKELSSLNDRSRFKPQFINLASPGSANIFLKAAFSNKYLIIEEELPVNANKNIAKELILESAILTIKSNDLEGTIEDEVNKA